MPPDRRAKECGSSVASFICSADDGDLVASLKSEIESAVKLNKRSRIYVVYNHQGRHKGKFVVGGRPLHGLDTEHQEKRTMTGRNGCSLTRVSSSRFEPINIMPRKTVNRLSRYPVAHSLRRHARRPDRIARFESIVRAPNRVHDSQRTRSMRCCCAANNSVIPCGRRGLGGRQRQNRRDAYVQPRRLQQYLQRQRSSNAVAAARAPATPPVGRRW